MAKHMLNTDDPDPKKWVDMCDYKNCRKPVKAGFVVCEKHIGQNKRDFDKTHFTLGNMVFRCDKKTARIMNKNG